MTSYGRRHTMSALIVIGNGNGLGGYALGKAGLKHYIRSVVNGMKMASRKLVYVELLENRTIYQDFYAECRGTRIFAQRRPKDFGVVAHPRITKICEVMLSILEKIFCIILFLLSFTELIATVQTIIYQLLVVQIKKLNSLTCGDFFAYG